MLVIGIDSSAAAASAAICETGANPRVIAQTSINAKITHSQTLVPILEGLLKNASVKLEDADGFAVSGGPGSFTGLRIGISAVKGMAYALGKPCFSVSTLHALAYNLIGRKCIACAVMDARCNQVYNALFRIDGEKIERITEDRALFIAELEADLEKYSEPVVFVGDGAELCYKNIHLPGVELAPALLRFQKAESVCFASAEYEPIEARELMPSYLRLPQAERERLARENKEEKL